MHYTSKKKVKLTQGKKPKYKRYFSPNNFSQK